VSLHDYVDFRLIEAAVGIGCAALCGLVIVVVWLVRR